MRYLGTTKEVPNSSIKHVYVNCISTHLKRKLTPEDIPSPTLQYLGNTFFNVKANKIFT